MYHEVLCTYLIKSLMGILYLSKQAFQGVFCVHCHSWPYFCLSISRSWCWKIVSLLSKVFQQRYLRIQLPLPILSKVSDIRRWQGRQWPCSRFHGPFSYLSLIHKHINFMLGGWVLSKKLYYKEVYLSMYHTKS